MFLDGLKFEFEHTNQSLQNYIKRFVNNFYFEDTEYKKLVLLMKLMILLIKLINTFYILA